jgi:hypothetical protein
MKREMWVKIFEATYSRYTTLPVLRILKRLYMKNRYWRHNPIARLLTRNQSNRVLAVMIPILIVSWFNSNSFPHPQNFSKSTSSFLGGSGIDQGRDIIVDSQGFIYITGGTSSADFPRTTGPALSTGACQNPGTAGNWDVFVTKLDPTGKLVWSRLLGGPCYDRAYAIELDNRGNLYLAGRAGPGFPVTPSAVQPNFQGYHESLYGYQNAFIAGLNSDDGTLVWASYIGVSSLARDLAIDANGDLFVPLSYRGSGVLPTETWFTHAYQKTVKEGSENGIVKIKKDGSQVIWATWFGGTGDESLEASVRVNQNGIYFTFFTNSLDLPTTQGAFDQSFNGGVEDIFVAGLSLDGASLILGTYLGGSGTEYLNTHNLALGEDGTIYVSVSTDSRDYPITPNAFQSIYGGLSDFAVSRLSTTGDLLGSTYFGGSNNDNSDGIQIDTDGNVYITGNTTSTNLPITWEAFEPTLAGKTDAFVAKMSAELNQLRYASYLGGSGNDAGRSMYVDQTGNWVITGTSEGPGFPIIPTGSSSFAGGATDCFVVKLVPGSTRLFLLPLVRKG